MNGAYYTKCMHCNNEVADPDLVICEHCMWLYCSVCGNIEVHDKSGLDVCLRCDAGRPIDGILAGLINRLETAAHERVPAAAQYASNWDPEDMERAYTAEQTGAPAGRLAATAACT